MRPAGAVGWSDVASGEALLVQRCVAGDEQACRELVEEHQRMVYQLAVHLLADQEEALDLSQDVFMRVFRTLQRFRGESALRTWIYRIVINQARNRQRWWRRRHQAQQLSFEEHTREHGELAAEDGRSSPDRLLDQKELGRRVWTALGGLPFDQRSAIVLREIDGLSYQEIAFSLGIAVGTVKSRLARARESLRDALRNECSN